LFDCTAKAIKIRKVNSQKFSSKLYFDAFKLVRKKKSSLSKRKAVKSYETVSDDDEMIRKSSEVKGVQCEDVSSVDCGKGEEFAVMDMTVSKEADGEVNNSLVQSVSFEKSEEVTGEKSREVVECDMLESAKSDHGLTPCIANEIKKNLVILSTFQVKFMSVF